MDNYFTFGVFLAPLLGIILSLYLFKKWNTEGATVNNSENGVVKSEKELEEDDGLDFEVIIVGAGVAGSALAYALGKEGRRVQVIERDLTEPNRIVGEILQPGGYLKLVELGLEDCVDNIDAQRLVGYFLYKDGKSIKLTYPLEKFHSDVAGRSFHNGRFVQRMREKAATLPNVKFKQGTVTSLIEDNGIIKGVRYKIQTVRELEKFAPLTIVCDGCFSNLRRKLCIPKIEVSSYCVAMILKNCKLPVDNHGHVILANPAPIVLYQISSTELRCYVDVPGQKVPSVANGAMNTYLKATVAPCIPPELRDAFIAVVDSGTIRTMPIHIMPADPYLIPGVLLLGDALNMRHSITGGGMTVALSDVALIHTLLKAVPDLRDSSSLCNSFESFYIMRKPMAFIINTVANALHKVFSESNDENRRNETRRFVFDYLSLGGICSKGVVALFSGLNPNLFVFALHFVAAGMYGVGRLLLPFPSLKNLWSAAQLIWDAAEVIFPILRAEGFRKTLSSTIRGYCRAP